MNDKQEIESIKKFPFYWKQKNYTPNFKVMKTIHAFGDHGDGIEFEIFGDKYKNNSSGVRCDEFTTDHKGKHILFAGCSITAGSGLNQEETWAYRVYSKIKETEKLSGYYNIGVPGGSTGDIILSEIMKYCKNFGNPEVLFVMLPGTDRDYRFVNSKHALKEFIFRCYLVLDQYCKSNNIELYTFTWTQKCGHIGKWVHEDWLKYDFLFDMFDTFYDIKEDDFLADMYEYEKSNKNDKKAFLASDNDHPGNMWHYAWANFIYGRYREVHKKN